MALALGKLLRTGLRGVNAIKNGGWSGFIIGFVLELIVRPTNTITVWYWTLLILRLIIKIAFSVLGTENKYKQWLYMISQVLNLLGILLLSRIKWAYPEWRHLTLAFIGSFIALLFNVRSMTGPHRILTTSNELEKAQEIDNSCYRTISSASLLRVWPKSLMSEVPKILTQNENFIHCTWKILRRKHSLNVYFSLCTSFLTYYVLAANMKNSSTNPCFYLLLMNYNGIIPGYMQPLVLMLLERRKTSTILPFIIAAAALLCIPKIFKLERDIGVTRRLSMLAFNGFIILYTTELHTIVMRTCGISPKWVKAQFRAMTTPNLPHLSGLTALWTPIAICCIVAAVAGHIIVGPRIRSKPTDAAIAATHGQGQLS